MTTPTLQLSSTPDLIAQRLVPGSLQISHDLQRCTVRTFRLLLTAGLGLEIGQQVVLRISAESRAPHQKVRAAVIADHAAAALGPGLPVCGLACLLHSKEKAPHG